jgi:hypothetical protein
MSLWLTPRSWEGWKALDLLDQASRVLGAVVGERRGLHAPRPTRVIGSAPAPSVIEVGSAATRTGLAFEM